jgi:hypothetical protein
MCKGRPISHVINIPNGLKWSMLDKKTSLPPHPPSHMRICLLICPSYHMLGECATMNSKEQNEHELNMRKAKHMRPSQPTSLATSIQEFWQTQMNMSWTPSVGNVIANVKFESSKKCKRNVWILSSWGGMYLVEVWFHEDPEFAGGWLHAPLTICIKFSSHWLLVY